MKNKTETVLKTNEALGFQQFADQLKRVEDAKRQKIRFCKEHNFGHEVEWLQSQVRIIQEIRFELEAVYEGRRKPSEATFIDL